MDQCLQELKASPNCKEVQTKCIEAILDYHMDTKKGNIELVKQLLKTSDVDSRYEQIIKTKNLTNGSKEDFR